jgi:glycosyltransferase involved in cell wall biosynthesis
MTKILLVAPVPSHPSTTGASTRVRQMAESLRCLGHEVHFLHLQQPLWMSDAAIREYWGDRYHVFRGLGFASCVSRAVRKLRRIRAKTFGINLPVDSYFDPECARHARDQVAHLGFQVVIVSYVFYSRIFDAFPAGTVKIVDTHDIFSDRYRLYQQHGQQAEFFSTTPAEEARALDRADLVLAIQGSDAAHFRGLTGKQVAVVGHLAAPTLRAATKPVVKGSMLFVGGPMSINGHGVAWFIQKVLPRVRSWQPDSELWLAGGISRHFPGAPPGVRRLGYVEDVSELYERASVVINPQQFGTGLSIKCVEALLHGRPLVTTASGARGLEEGDGSAFLTARSADEFGDHLLTLMQDPKRAALLELNAASFAQRYHQENTQTLAEVVGSVGVAS